MGRVLSPRVTLFQENSIYQIPIPQKFAKPDLTQIRQEQKGCEKL